MCERHLLYPIHMQDPLTSPDISGEVLHRHVGDRPAHALAFPEISASRLLGWHMTVVAALWRG